MSRQMILKMAGLSDRNAGLNNDPIIKISDIDIS